MNGTNLINGMFTQGDLNAHFNHIHLFTVPSYKLFEVTCV